MYCAHVAIGCVVWCVVTSVGVGWVEYVVGCSVWVCCYF